MLHNGTCDDAAAGGTAEIIDLAPDDAVDGAGRSALLGKHSTVTVKVRFWMIDEWTNDERAYLYIDDVKAWEGYRNNSQYCDQESWSSTGDLILPFTGRRRGMRNDWAGNNPNHQCYVDIQVTVPHNGPDVKLTFRATLKSSTYGYDSWAFNRLRIYADDAQAYPGIVTGKKATWSNTYNYNSGDGYVHGPWDGNTRTVEATFGLWMYTLRVQVWLPCPSRSSCLRLCLCPMPKLKCKPKPKPKA